MQQLQLASVLKLKLRLNSIFNLNLLNHNMVSRKSFKKVFVVRRMQEVNRRVQGDLTYYFARHITTIIKIASTIRILGR